MKPEFEVRIWGSNLGLEFEALTKNLSNQQESNGQIDKSSCTWQGFKDLILNPTKYMVALGEFNVECAKSVLERHGFA